MLKKSLLVVGTLATLVLNGSIAEARSYRASCDAYAKRIAYRQGGGDGANVVGGVVGGAVAGGIVGGIVGNGQGNSIGTGALIGGVTGGALGAASGDGRRYDRYAYEEAYSQCMNDRGRTYISQDQPRSRSYSRQRYNSRDVQYCSQRYRSYNPDTGTYLSSSGQYRPCP